MNTVPYVISAFCTASAIVVYDYFIKVQGFLYYNIRNPKNDEILSKCPEIKNRRFYPSFLFHSELAQVIMASILPSRKNLTFKKEPVDEKKYNKIGIFLTWANYKNPKKVIK